ncbi:MAG TPA: hypothetical protein GXX35_12580 [Thermoanaerobacterales bacterium]|nr:hypothetical protein [Thermoanaerobacterales bacterium]
MQQKLTYEYEDTNRLDYRYKLMAEEKIFKANKETLDNILDDIFTIEKIEDLDKYY